MNIFWDNSVVAKFATVKSELHDKIKTGKEIIIGALKKQRKIVMISISAVNEKSIDSMNNLCYDKVISNTKKWKQFVRHV